MTTKLLKKALSNVYRHRLSLRAGILNAVNGNCLWDAIINNILGRGCYKKNSKQLRVRSITEAQLEKNILTFIRSDNTDSEWDHMKKKKESMRLS